MKRVFSWILAAMVLLMPTAGLCEAVYDEEILFRGLPWMMDMESYIEALSEDVEGGYPYRDETPKMIFSQALRDEQPGDAVYTNGYLRTLYNFRDNFRVAGYEVDWIWVYGLWSIASNGTIIDNVDKTRVFRAEYTFALDEKSPDEVETIWDDLKEKLILVYGEGYIDQSSPNDYEGFRYRRLVWYGQNDTYVMLRGWLGRTENQHPDTINIQYGRSDDNALIQEVCNAKWPDKSTDGL